MSDGSKCDGCDGRLNIDEIDIRSQRAFQHDAGRFIHKKIFYKTSLLDSLTGKNYGML